MSQRTLFALPRFTQQAPPQKKGKKRLSCKDASSDQEDAVIGIDKNDHEIVEKEVRRKAWNEAWTRTFEWAYFDHNSAKMFCTYCKKDKDCKSEFGNNGSKNIQHSALTEHSRCRSHEEAKYLCGAKKVRIEVGMQKNKAAIDKATSNLFMAAYHVAKEDLSFCKFPAVLDLLSYCDCPHLTRELYHNDKSCATFVQYISEDLLIKIMQRLRASSFFSLMMDESTDIRLNQHLVVYASFIEDFEPVTIFLGLLEIQDGTSQHLYECSLHFLSQLHLNIQNMVCLGTDGASSMVGHVNGLTTRFKRQNPFMTSIHCVAHRTNLCLADAVKKSDYAQDMDKIINEIAFIFGKSAQKNALLESLEAEFGCSILHMSRIHKVRWLSRSTAIHKVCESFEPLLVFLKAQHPTLFEKVSNFQFIYSLHFMADILEKLAILNKIFQSTFVDVTTIGGLVEAEIRLLQMQFIEEPVFDVNAATFDSKGFHIIPDYGPRDGQLTALRASMRGNMYRSVLIERDFDGMDLENAVSFQRDFSRFIIENLLERFPDKDLTACFKALAPCTFPSGLELKNYGFTEIDTLASFYGEAKALDNGELLDPLVDKVAVKREYQYFKAQAPYEWKGRSLRDTWVAIGRNSTSCDKYPMLLRLAHIAMLQCSSTAACERGFSVQNLIKTKLRNCLNTKNVDALMRISIEGPPLNEHGLDDAIQLWKNTAKTSRHIYGESKRVDGVMRI